MYIYTCNINTAKKYIAMNKIPENCFIDTTVKSGVKLFAPTWQIVMDHKNGLIDDQQYISMYLKILNKNYNENKQVFDYYFKNTKAVVLMCYCPANAFCHRTILSSWLVGKDYGKYVRELL
jgi:uncharacterized protein YeaO (DUF488 family)